MDTFGQRIKRARREQKLTQRELAKRVNVNFTYLSKIENGDMPPPSEEKIYKLAENLNIHPDELFILAHRLSDELVDLAARPHMPTILRAAKDLSDSERKEMLDWIEQRHAANKTTNS